MSYIKEILVQTGETSYQFCRVMENNVNEISAILNVYFLKTRFRLCSRNKSKKLNNASCIDVALRTKVDFYSKVCSTTAFCCIRNVAVKFTSNKNEKKKTVT